MRLLEATLSSTAVGLGALWLAGVRLHPHRTLMRYGFAEVRARGEGIDSVRRTEAYYWHAGLLNPNSSGWYIHYGRAIDDPRGYTWAEPDPWCGVVLLTPRPLRTGITFRIDSPDPETRLALGGLVGTPHPYRNFAKQGVLQVDEASRQVVRGRFHLTLSRYRNAESGPPVEVEGRFDVRRKPPPQ